MHVAAVPAAPGPSACLPLTQDQGPEAAAASLAASRLPHLACGWLRASAALPPVVVEPTTDGLLALRLCVACLPVPSGHDAGAGAALQGGVEEAEAQLLLQLLRHQVRVVCVYACWRACVAFCSDRRLHAKCWAVPMVGQGGGPAWVICVHEESDCCAVHCVTQCE